MTSGARRQRSLRFSSQSTCWRDKLELVGGRQYKQLTQSYKQAGTQTVARGTVSLPTVTKATKKLGLREHLALETSGLVFPSTS